MAAQRARSSHERWAADVEAVLDRVESGAEFDVVELRRLQALAGTHGYNPGTSESGPNRRWEPTPRR